MYQGHRYTHIVTAVFIITDVLIEVRASIYVLAKEAFIKNCFLQYGNIDAGACTHKVVLARAMFLYRVGKLLQAYPQTQVLQMKNLGEIEVQLAQDLVGANAFLVPPQPVVPAQETKETIEEQPCQHVRTYVCAQFLFIFSRCLRTYVGM